jgi:hypothetical protein
LGLGFSIALASIGASGIVPSRSMAASASNQAEQVDDDGMGVLMTIGEWIYACVAVTKLGLQRPVSKVLKDPKWPAKFPFRPADFQR